MLRFAQHDIAVLSQLLAPWATLCRHFPRAEFFNELLTPDTRTSASQTFAAHL